MPSNSTTLHAALTISFGFAMVNYYTTPIPGVGASFHNLITDESQFLRPDQPSRCRQSSARGRLRIPHRIPGVADFLGTIIYAVGHHPARAAQAIAIVVIAYGFIATAVCVLVGPIFITFLYCSEAGVALLGLVQVLPPICLLPGHRSAVVFVSAI